MSLFQQSSLTFSQAKDIVAEVAGKEDAPTIIKDRAGRSIQAALRYWNRADWWDWTRELAADVAVDGSSTTQYDLPYNCRGLYDVQVVGTNNAPRTYFFVRRRQYDRLNLSQPSSYPEEYDLFLKGGFGKIDLLGLSGTGTLKMRQYRKLLIPCALTGITCSTTSASKTITGSAGAFAGAQIGAAVTGTNIGASAVVTAITNTSITVSVNSTATGSTTIAVGASTDYLDIPADWEDGILAWAKHHFGVDQPGVDQNRLSYWKSYSTEILNTAKGENNYNEDEEISFVAPADELGMQ